MWIFEIEEQLNVGGDTKFLKHIFHELSMEC